MPRAPCPPGEPLHMEDFHHVANAWATDLEHAITMTNTIEGGWWKNVGVRFLGCHIHGMKGARSTSVGDVIGHEGRYWMVAAVGFTEVKLYTDREMLDGGPKVSAAGGAA
jgi:hypothetical protein